MGGVYKQSWWALRNPWYCQKLVKTKWRSKLFKSLWFVFLMEKILYSLPSTHQSVSTSLRLPTLTSLPLSFLSFVCLHSFLSFPFAHACPFFLSFLRLSLRFCIRCSCYRPSPCSVLPFPSPLSIDPFLIYLPISPLTLSFLSTFYPSSLPSIFVYLLIQLWICFICSFREIKDPKERKVKLVYLARKATKDGRDLRERLDLMAHR